MPSACHQEPLPQVGRACVEQQNRLMAAAKLSQRPRPMQDYVCQLVIVDPGTLVSPHPDVTRKCPIGSHLAGEWLRQNVLIADEDLWQLRLNAGVVAQKGNQ